MSWCSRPPGGSTTRASTPSAAGLQPQLDAALDAGPGCCSTCRAWSTSPRPACAASCWRRSRPARSTAHGRRRAAPGGGRDLRDQPLQHGVPRLSRAARGARLPRPPTPPRRSSAASGHARALLGDPRLDPGLAHLARRARPAGARAGAGGAAQPRHRREGAGLRRRAFRVLAQPHLRRPFLLRRAGDRGQRRRRQYFVCDMGSGARAFGEHVLARQAQRPATVNVFMSHLHWDHIMGFPFFGPAYRARVPPAHPRLPRGARARLPPAAGPALLPGAVLRARRLDRVRAARAGRDVPDRRREGHAQLQLHSGDSYGYRFEAGGKTVVYTTDSEHKLEKAARREKFAIFFRDADLVIFDAMYSLAEAISVKADWGHSSNVVGVELCQMAGAKRLALFHHEPANDDARHRAHPGGDAPPRGADARAASPWRSSPPTTAWRSISEPGAASPRPRCSALLARAGPLDRVRRRRSRRCARRCSTPTSACCRAAHERAGDHRRDRRERRSTRARPVALAAHARSPS